MNTFTIVTYDNEYTKQCDDATWKKYLKWEVACGELNKWFETHEDWSDINTCPKMKAIRRKVEIAQASLRNCGWGKHDFRTTFVKK